jgi:hypothetical protein
MIKYKMRKLFFETDGLLAHKTKRLNEWLAENSNGIDVFFLPPCSSKLNPPEYINQDVKQM